MAVLKIMEVGHNDGATIGECVVSMELGHVKGLTGGEGAVNPPTKQTAMKMGHFLEHNDRLDKSGDTRHSGPSTFEGKEAKKS
jgi:hypothetical protein